MAAPAPTRRGWPSRAPSFASRRRWTMRSDAARTLESLAASIADGASVDWNGSAASLSADEQRLLRHLRVVDSLAEVYRTLPPAAGDGESDSLAQLDPAGPRWGRLIL